MRIVFAGSSEYAVPALEELVARRKHQIVLVLSQPARPKGRKLILEDTPLTNAAMLLGLNVYCPEDVNSLESLTRISKAVPHILITASFGAFLGKELRELPRYGAINLHPSLLPLHRGSSPVRSAILSGDVITGNSIFRLSRKMDAGPILMQEQLQIGDDENYSSLHDRLANQAAMMLPDLLDRIPGIEEQKQDHSRASYSKLITKSDLKLDFTLPAADLIRRIRAYALEPGAYTVFRGRELKILSAVSLPSPKSYAPGCISAVIKNKGFTIAASDAELLISSVQAAGKTQMDAYTYSLGARFKPGERIDQ